MHNNESNTVTKPADPTTLQKPIVHLTTRNQQKHGPISTNIRLGCMHCDRSDFDGVNELPSDWQDISEVQSYEESVKPAAPDDSNCDVTFWETHMGVCPDCQEHDGKMDADVCFRDMLECHAAGAWKTAQRQAAKLRQWLDAGGRYPSEQDMDYVDLMLDDVLNDY